MVGNIAETGQVVAVEFRASNDPSSKDDLGFIQHCQLALPAEGTVSHFRADAASYQARVINHMMANDIGFAVRARLARAGQGDDHGGPRVGLASFCVSGWKPIGA